jgi:glycosyltransferase involved in cell wall biosynthesis
VSGPSGAGSRPDEGGLDAGVLLVAEQLRRAVPGGIGTYVAGLARGLAALGPISGAPVTLFASRVRGADPLDALGLPVETAALSARALVKAWDLGTASIGRGRAVVHATSMAVPPAKAPLVATVHDLAWRRLPEAYPPRGLRWHGAALARTLRRAERFVVPSDPVADELRELLPGREACVVVIEEGSDHLPPPDAEAARELLGRLGVGAEFLLAVGTLEPRKNLSTLFRAYGRARDRLPEPWPLVVVGPAGWGEAPGERPDGVVLAGKVDAAVLAALYASARCVAYVPLKEGFGLPVVEAMRAGAPVVSSPVPSAKGAALEVDPLDADAVADALICAAADEGVRARLIASGHARTETLTWEKAATAHVALWRDVASKRR